MEKKGKCEKMADMMTRCFTGEGNMVDCGSMMRKMMEFCQGGETKGKKKDTQETE